MYRSVLLISPLVLAACGSRPEAGDGRSDVVLVVVDSPRRDPVGGYGCELDTSATIDRLAQRGRPCTRAIPQAPGSAASIGSLLASRGPGAPGLGGEAGVHSEELGLVSEVLQREGYRTGAVVSHPSCTGARGVPPRLECQKAVRSSRLESIPDTLWLAFPGGSRLGRRPATLG